MSASVTFYGKDLKVLGTYTVPSDASIITTFISPMTQWSELPSGFSVTASAETGNDMVKARINALENRFRRLLEELSDAIDRVSE